MCAYNKVDETKNLGADTLRALSHHTNTHNYKHKHANKLVNTHTHTRAYTCRCAPTTRWTRLRIWGLTRYVLSATTQTHTQLQTQAHKQTRKHTHTHTHIHLQVCAYNKVDVTKALGADMIRALSHHAPSMPLAWLVSASNCAAALKLEEPQPQLQVCVKAARTHSCVFTCVFWLCMCLRLCVCV